jgi:hypothetical protein
MEDEARELKSAATMVGTALASNGSEVPSADGAVRADARPADTSAARADAGVSSCPNCGETLAGVYCHRCGEKRPEARDLSVRHFVGEAVQELSSVEHSKLFHTLLALLFRPGLLTLEWIAGRRSRYLKPLNLCLGVFAVTLFAYSVYKPVSMYDLGNLFAQDKTGSVAPLERVAAKKHMETGELLDRVSERWQRYVSLSPLFLAAAFALVLQLVFLSSRRYFVEHLVFSMHFFSFTMLTFVLLWPVYFFTGIKSGGVNTLVAVAKWLLDIVYMFFAVRAVYRMGTARTLLASLLLVLGYFLIYVLTIVVTFVAALIVVARS